jgi:hypothetical protein
MDNQLLKDLEHLQVIKKEAIGAFSFVANGKEYSPLSRVALGADYVGGKAWGAGKKTIGAASKGLDYLRTVPGIKHIVPKKLTTAGAILGAGMTALWVVPTMMDAAKKAQGAAGVNTARQIAKQPGW